MKFSPRGLGDASPTPPRFSHKLQWPGFIVPVVENAAKLRPCAEKAENSISTFPRARIATASHKTPQTTRATARPITREIDPHQSLHHHQTDQTDAPDNPSDRHPNPDRSTRRSPSRRDLPPSDRSENAKNATRRHDLFSTPRGEDQPGFGRDASYSSAPACPSTKLPLQPPDVPAPTRTEARAAEGRPRLL